jgi:hypothetical protein
LGFLLHDEPGFRESLCEQEPPVKKRGSAPMLILLFSAGVSKIDMGPKDTHDEFEPICLFQKREHQPTGMRPLLLELQLPANTIVLPVLVLLGLSL